MESNNSNDLKGLQGKKIQLNFINPASSEESTVSGRLLSVTSDLIVVEGAVMRTQLYRKHIKIISVDYVEGENEALMKLIIRRAKRKIAVHDWTRIGEMIEQGLTEGKNRPKGIDWQLVSWSMGEVGAPT